MLASSGGDVVLGRVVGKAVSTAKHPSLGGSKLLVVEPIRAASLDPVLCIDELGARAGDVVVMSNDGKFAREIVKDEASPARWWVMGIVDDARALL
jgi:ethanolamine utilization protein EutN